MRIDKHLPALVLAAMLGTALSACQRQEVPSTRIDFGLPAPPGERFGTAPVPGTNAEQSPGTGGSFDPGHPPARGPGLIEI